MEPHHFFTDDWLQPVIHLQLAVLVESTSVGKLVATNKKWNLREGFGDNQAIQKVASKASRIPITFCMVKHPRVPGSDSIFLLTADYSATPTYNWLRPVIH